jgi:hypothetical protein
MKSKSNVSRISVLALLSCKLLLGNGQKERTSVTDNGAEPPLQRSLMLRRSASDHSAVTPRNPDIFRRRNKDISEQTINNSEDEEDFTLDHDPQRHFEALDYATKAKLMESYNQDQIENLIPHGRNKLGVGKFRDTHNITNANDGDDDENDNQDGDGSNPSGSSAAGDESLEENTEVALLRHEEPLPERDVVGDSIFPLSQSAPSDNIFQNRQHDDAR